MLAELRVRNFVLIDSLELALSPGFNVLTGETGAGKSIVVGALGLVLGGRAAPGLVRPALEEAEIEALFDLSNCPSARERLKLGGFEGDEAVLRRVVSSTGRSRAYLNGRLCTAAQLAELAPDLVDISSQHESVALTDPASHLGYLDAFARLEAERLQLAASVDEIAERTRELRALREIERGRAEREAFLRFQIGAIDELAPHPSEWEELEAERGRLRHAERLGEISRDAADRLYDADGALCDELGRLGSALAAGAELDPRLGPAARSLESARSELADTARELARYAETLESNPARLGEVEERIFRLGKLIRQHGSDVADVLGARERMEAELGAMAGAEERGAKLAGEIESKMQIAAERARALSRARQGAARELGEKISAELRLLGMGSARVVVDVMPLEKGSHANELSVDGARLGRDGIDWVEFLIAPNPGVEPRPLRKIASGGELSRSLLALKRVLAGAGPAGLYVFDEVDTGVGGAIAERIGRAIADVARHRQVLCITHLAPIAAFAESHFVVEKKEENGLATTRVVPRTGKSRLDELARMLSGATVTAAGRKAAEEMLRSAAARPGVPQDA